ncbi:hypothetical protein EX30DRAFT_290181, partial [Ascodesmis nigricans]
MPRQELKYPQGPLNTVIRYGHNAHYDLETIHAIINSSPVSHITFNPPPSPPSTDPLLPTSPHTYPITLPLLCRTGNFTSPSSSTQNLYLHLSTSSRLYRLLPHPLTITTTHVDGLVLSLSPFSHSLNYRSATIFGVGEAVDDPAEKLYALELLTNGICPGRWDPQNVRLPPTKAELAGTGVVRVRVETGVAKVRVGGPGEERTDLGDEGVRERVWTGVVPCWTQWGEPVRGGGGRVEEVPEYLRAVLGEWNREG